MLMPIPMAAHWISRTLQVMNLCLCLSLPIGFPGPSKLRTYAYGYAYGCPFDFPDPRSYEPMPIPFPNVWGRRRYNFMDLGDLPVSRTSRKIQKEGVWLLDDHGNDLCSSL